MKVFWYTPTDELNMYPPRLYYARFDSDGHMQGVQEVLNPHQELPQILMEGFQEISARTAHTLGLPT